MSIADLSMEIMREELDDAVSAAGYEVYRTRSTDRPGYCGSVTVIEGNLPEHLSRIVRRDVFDSCTVPVFYVQTDNLTYEYITLTKWVEIAEFKEFQ